MAVFLRFMLVPALLTAGLSTAQAQCSRSAKAHCSQRSPESRHGGDGLQSAKPHCSRRAEAEPAPAAEPRRAALLRVGVGASLSGSGDYPVVKTHLEYAPQLGRHLRLGSRLAYIGGSQPYKLTDESDEVAVPQSYRAVNVEQEVYWLPFGASRLVEVGLGGGVFAGYSRAIGFSSAGFSLDASGNRQFSYVPRKEQGFHAGYIASLYLDCGLNEAGTWRLGGRLALQNDTRANILPGGQLQLSRAL